MAVGAVAAFTTPGGNYAVELALIAVVFTLINLPCVPLWALFGTGLGQLLTRDSWRRPFNLALAVLTIASAARFFLSGVQGCACRSTTSPPSTAKYFADNPRQWFRWTASKHVGCGTSWSEL